MLLRTVLDERWKFARRSGDNCKTEIEPNFRGTTAARINTLGWIVIPEKDASSAIPTQQAERSETLDQESES